MKSIKVCEYSRSRSFHDFILQDQASGERSQDQWSSGLYVAMFSGPLYKCPGGIMGKNVKKSYSPKPQGPEPPYLVCSNV